MSAACAPVPPGAPVIVAARRTAITTAGKGLARYDVSALAAPVLAALNADLAGMGITERIGDVILGNCLGPGGNPARVAALQAGLGLDVPGLTVDRQCGSGQEAIHLAAAAIGSGAGVILAGGAESASTAPWRMHRPRTPTGLPVPYERAPFAPSGIGDPDMGVAAENVARQARISRQRQDAYAVLSHERTLASRAAGIFDAEFVSVGGCTGPASDDRPRKLALATLSRLPAAFVPGGTVTAGNSCAISDGAAAVAVVPERVRARAGVPGLAIRAWAQAGGDPNLPGLCPVPAVRAVLAGTGLAMADIGAFETTEAFAAQVLATTDALGLDPLGDAADAARVCAEGGAIALGHPWGASGTALAVRLFSRMVRRAGARFGMAACAIGGGIGVAMMVERVGS